MIKKIYINNFKSIQNLEINCNPNFNIIMGENNMGKTTIFEAIRLWKLCYDKNIKTKKMGFIQTHEISHFMRWNFCVFLMILI